MCANYEPISKDRVYLLDLFEPTFEYKADVYLGYDCPLILTGLEPKADHTYDLLTDFEQIEKKELLMKTLENVHNKFGKKKLVVGPCYVPGRNSSMSRDKLSRNPFRRDELIEIK